MQIAFTGGFLGNLVEADRRGETGPTPAWEIPALLDSLRRDRTWQTLVIGVGNESSVFSAVSVADHGRLEEALGRACRYDATAVGPQDLARFRREKAPGKALYRRVWSNVANLDGEEIFPSHALLQASGYRIAVFSLISASFLVDLPLQEWGGLTVENPARCLRRLRPQAEGADFVLVISHLDAADLAEVTREAAPETRFILVPQAAPPGRGTAADRGPSLREARGERAGRVADPSPAETRACAQPGGIFGNPPAWEMGEGSREVSVYRREARAGTHDWEKWHRFPLAKAGHEKAGAALFSRHRQRFERGWHRPLFYLNTNDLLPGSLYRLSPSFHARLAREIGRSDLALVALEDEIPGDARALTPAILLSHFPNRFLREYELPGTSLKTLFFAIGHGNFPYRIGLSGAQCAFLGGSPSRLTVQGKPINDMTRYRLMLDAHLFDDPVLQEAIALGNRSGQRGITLWDAWLELLPGTAHGSGIVAGERQ